MTSFGAVVEVAVVEVVVEVPAVVEVLAGTPQPPPPRVLAARGRRKETLRSKS